MEASCFDWAALFLFCRGRRRRRRKRRRRRHYFSVFRCFACGIAWAELLFLLFWSVVKEERRSTD